MVADGTFDMDQALTPALAEEIPPSFRSKTQSDPYDNVSLNAELDRIADLRGTKILVSTKPGNARGYGFPEKTRFDQLLAYHNAVLRDISEPDGKISFLKAAGITHTARIVMGSWEGLEPSIEITFPDIGLETANILAPILGDALMQDAAITIVPEYEGQHFGVEIQKPSGEAFSDEELSAILDQANPEHDKWGLNFTTTADKTGIRFLDGTYFEDPDAYKEENLTAFMGQLKEALGPDFKTITFRQNGELHELDGPRDDTTDPIRDNPLLARKPFLQRVAVDRLYRPAWAAYRAAHFQITGRSPQTPSPLAFASRHFTRDEKADARWNAGQGLAIREDGSVPLTHWSKTEDLSNLDPDFHGTAAAGAEKARMGPDYKNRTYYGLPSYKREMQVPDKARYFAVVDPAELYDFQGDPLALFERLQWETKAVSPVAVTTEVENALLDLGYKGYFGDGGAGPTVALFGKHSVAEVTDLPLETHDVAGFDERGKPQEKAPKIYFQKERGVDDIQRDYLKDMAEFRALIDEQRRIVDANTAFLRDFSKGPSLGKKALAGRERGPTAIQREYALVADELYSQLARRHLSVEETTQFLRDFAKGPSLNKPSLMKYINTAPGEESETAIKPKRAKKPPKKTVKAYKLFRVDPKRPGEIFPLFVLANKSVPVGEWVDAEVGPAAGDKVKSKLGKLAFRPGWHASDLPVATHIGAKSDPSQKAPNIRPPNQIWAEVELPDDVDWQSEADRRVQLSKEGKPIARTAHITDQVPEGGHYRYKTNPNMTGEWMIGGSMKVVRLLSDAEVQQVNKGSGVEDLPRAVSDRFAQREPLPQIAYHGTPHQFDRFTLDHIGTGEGIQAYGWGLYFAGNREIAKFYRDTLTARDAEVIVYYKGEPAYSNRTGYPLEAEGKPNTFEELASIIAMAEEKTVDGAIDLLRSNMEFGVTEFYTEQDLQDDRNAIEILKAARDDFSVEKRDTGQLIKAEIPESDELLDWDKPLSEQPKGVQVALKNAILNLDLTEDQLADFDVASAGEFFAEILAKPDVVGAAVYDTLQDLLRVDQRGVSEFLEKSGIPGLQYLDAVSRGAGEGTHNFVIFDEEAIRILDELQQKRQEGAIKGTFTPSKNLIELFAAADKSTLLHESAHFFLHTMDKMASSASAPQALKDEFTQVLNWLGAASFDDVTVEQHEQFARTWEAYVTEGRAPSVALATVFEHFTSWLLAIYRFAAGIPEQKIDPEIRGIFDRLLASQDEIAEAESYHATYEDVRASFERAANLDEVEQERLREQRTKAKKNALQNRRSRVLKAYLKARSKEGGFKEEAEAAANKEPVYRLLTALAEGKGLSAGILDDLVGPDDRKAFAKKLVGKRIVQREGGRDPEVVAEEFGFGDVDEMVNAVLDAPNRSDYVSELVESMVGEAEYEIQSALQDPEAVTADESWHNDERLQLLVSTIEALEAQRQGAKRKVHHAAMRARALRAVARDTLGKMNVKEAGAYSRFSAQEVRARKKAIAARDKGDTATMVNWLEAEALAHALVLESVKARDEAAKIARRLKRAEKAKIADAWQQQLYRILARLGRAQPGQLKEDSPNLATFTAGLVDPEDELAYAIPTWSDWLYADTPIILEDLSLDQIRELDDLVKWIRGKGKEELSGTLLTYDDTLTDKVSDATAPMESMKPKRIVDSDKHPKLARWSDNFRKFIASHEMLGYLLDAADGFRFIQKKKGPEFRGPNKEMHDRLGVAQSAFDRRTADIQEKLKGPMKVLQDFQRRHGRGALKVNVPTPPVLKQNGRGWSAERIIAAALNMGNHENMVRLLEGFGLAETKNLKPGDIPDVLFELTKPLGDAEWGAIQEIWDIIEEQYPDLAETFQRLNKFRMAKVESRPITLPNGTVIRGGYYPAAYDPVLNKRAGQWTEKDDLLNRTEALYRTPATKSGMTKARVGGAGRPLNLSLHVLLTHLIDTARYTTHAEVVKDVDRVTQHADFEAEYKRVFGRQAYDMIRPALRWVARPQGEMGSVLDNWADRSRTRATAYILAVNFSVAAKQAFSLPGAVKMMGARNYLSGVARVLKNPLESRRMMREASAFMETRSKSFDRELADALRNFSDRPRELAGWSMADVRDAMFALIKGMDFLTVFPVWVGAYEQHMQASNGNFEEAVQYADEIVRATQPSAKPLDLNYFQRSKLGIHRMLSFFMTFTAKYGNRQRHYYRAFQQGKISKREYLGHVFIEAVAPPVLMNLMFSALWGNMGEDWEEPEDKMLELVGDVALYQTSGYLLLRDIAASALAAFDDKRYQSNPWDSPIWTAVELGQRATKAAASGDVERMAREAAELFSYQIQVPVARVTRKLLQGIEQYEKGKGTIFNVLVPEPRRK
jgi:hypothetical protein